MDEAAQFRDLLDRFFHNAPIEADGTIRLDNYGRSLFWKLSELTYLHGKPKRETIEELVSGITDKNRHPEI